MFDKFLFRLAKIIPKEAASFFYLLRLTIAYGQGTSEDIKMIAKLTQLD